MNIKGAISVFAFDQTGLPALNQTSLVHLKSTQHILAVEFHANVETIDMTRPHTVVMQTVAAAVVGFGGVAVLTSPQTAISMVGRFVGPAVGCTIKGNISVSSGERIYHVPGQTYYDDTVISQGKGERWFCSEEEARKAGWRRAKA